MGVPLDKVQVTKNVFGLGGFWYETYEGIREYVEVGECRSGDFLSLHRDDWARLFVVNVSDCYFIMRILRSSLNFCCQ